MQFRDFSLTLVGRRRENATTGREDISLWKQSSPRSVLGLCFTEEAIKLVREIDEKILAEVIKDRVGVS